MIRGLKDDLTCYCQWSKLFVNKDVPGNSNKFMVSRCFLSYSSIGLKPNPDTHMYSPTLELQKAPKSSHERISASALKDNARLAWLSTSNPQVTV
jgi:hypothetical protein